MKLLFKKIFTFLQNCLLIKYYILLLSYFLKLQITLLNVVAKNHFLYFIYITLIIYCYYGCVNDVECNKSHFIAFILVHYLMGTSTEIYFLCQISTTRNWIIKLVGQEYFIANFPNGNQLVLKYFLPLFFLTIFETLSIYLMQSFYFGIEEVNTEAYKELYGYDPLNWQHEVKEKYLKERFDRIMGSYRHGALTYVAHKMTAFYNFIVKIFSNFF